MAALHDMSALGFAGLNYSTGCLFRKNHSGHLASDEWKRIASDCVLLLVAKARLGCTTFDHTDGRAAASCTIPFLAKTLEPPGGKVYGTIHI